MCPTDGDMAASDDHADVPIPTSTAGTTRVRSDGKPGRRVRPPRLRKSIIISLTGRRQADGAIRSNGENTTRLGFSITFDRLPSRGMIIIDLPFDVFVSTA